MKFTVTKPNYQLVLSVSAIFLSICGLLISTYQAKIARENQQTSVLPYLQIRHERQDNGLEVRLENQGVGPAIIKEIVIQRNKTRADTYLGFVLEERERLRYIP